jgi:hypothetical protein
MSKFDFIANLEEDSRKKKFQVFETVMGFEHASVLIPLEHADDFLSEALEIKPKSKSSMKKLASKYGGRLE